MAVTQIETEDALIKQVLGEFLPRFASHGIVRYIRDADWIRQNRGLIDDLGLTPQMRRRMPDVLIYEQDRKRLILIDVSTSQGVMTAARRDELARMYFGTRAELVFVTAFPNRDAMCVSAEEIAWETLAWIADEPAHLTHFNGDRFLGPYGSGQGPGNPHV